MGSSRFPGKILEQIGNWSLIELVLQRVSKASSIDEVVLATSDSKRDDILDKHVRELGFHVSRGSEDDVLSRFYDAAKIYDPTVVVRISGDCPLISPKLIDFAVERFFLSRVDYLTLSIGREKEKAFPRGFDVEVAKFESITTAAQNATEQYEREHVMPYLYTHQDMFSVEYVDPENEFSRPSYRLCVDTKEDMELIQKVHDSFGSRLIEIDATEIIEFLDNNPEIATINLSVEQRHFKDSGQNGKQ
jgi:spore coat polysaccharide biosynthesis protein SpsF